MDWIERSLGIGALDNGDGSLEALVVMALAVVAGLLSSAAHRPLRAWLSR